MNKFWSQAIKEPDKKMVLSIVLSSVTEALRERPDRYDIILNNNDYTSNERQDAVLEVSNRLTNSLLVRLVNDTMSTLESETESEAAEETESTEVEAEAAGENTGAAAEEETKPEE